MKRPVPVFNPPPLPLDIRLMNNGFVVDYADLHFGEFRPFLIFNLADAAISIGVLIILARSFLSREKHEEPASLDEPAQAATES